MNRSYALGLLFLVSLLNYLDRYVVAILLPAIDRDLNLTDTQVGFITGLAFAMFHAVVSIPIGYLADQTSRRKVIASAVALWSAMTIACGLSQNFIQLALARVVLGIGEAGATPPSHSLISDLFPARDRAFALSLFSMGLPVGLLLAFLGGSHLVEAYGWRMTLFLCGAPGLVLAAILWITLPEPSRANSTNVVTAQNSLRSIREVMAALAREPSFVNITLGSSFFTVVYLGLITWLPTLFTRKFDLTISEVGTWLAIILGSSQILGLALGGYLSDRLVRKDPRWPAWICASASLLPMPFLVLALVLSNPYAAMACLFPGFLLGLMQGGPAVAMIQIVAKPTERAITVAVYLVVVNLISGLGAQLIGMLSDALGTKGGGNALGLAMLIVTVAFSIPSIWQFYRAGRTLSNHAAISSSV